MNSDHKRAEETRLLANIAEALPRLEELWQESNSHWGYEDPVYRFYHQSFKVYGLQGQTAEIVEAQSSLPTPTAIRIIERMNRVLFLCTGNYYRSRFAEHLFNWLASESDLPWRADSRGLSLWANLGPISRHAVEGLKERGVAVNGEDRHPIQLELADLAASDLVIAVKEAEHRAMLMEQFPIWANLVEYWHVDDLDYAEPEEALPILDGQVRALVERLLVAGGE